MDIRRARASRQSRQSARRLSPARADLAIATVLVLVLVASGTLGFALAGFCALALLAARIGWLVAAAVARRVTQRPRPARTGDRRRGPTPPQRALRILTMAALLTLPLATISYATAVSAPSNSSLAIRTVEWMRDNGAQWVVSNAESFFYTLTAPSRGGPALKQLPTTGVGGTIARSGPANVPAVIHPRLPGEGVWHPTQRRYSPATAPLLVTTYRPDPNYPRVVAGLARIDPHRARIGLYPGLKEPPGGGPRGGAAVPAALRSSLLGVFNSGFKHVDSQGGFFAGGHLYAPLQRGQGTIVGTTDGRLDVRSWTGGASPGPGTAFARQNLPLIVDGGRLNPSLGDSSRWGTTVGNGVMVWRSAVGVDRAGNLIYAAANYQSAKGIARILVHAGAVRAVELDINSYWVTFDAFAKPGGIDPHKLLPDMNRTAFRYLTPDDRDFFTVSPR